MDAPTATSNKAVHTGGSLRKGENAQQHYEAEVELELNIMVLQGTKGTAASLPDVCFNPGRDTGIHALSYPVECSVETVAFLRLPISSNGFDAMFVTAGLELAS